MHHFAGVWGFFQLNNWSFATRCEQYLAAEWPILVPANSAKTLQPFPRSAVLILILAMLLSCINDKETPSWIQSKCDLDPEKILHDIWLFDQKSVGHFPGQLSTFPTFSGKPQNFRTLSRADLLPKLKRKPKFWTILLDFETKPVKVKSKSFQVRWQSE